MKTETLPELQAVLNMKEWELDLAAWIFSGHSSLKKSTSGIIVRITDNQVIQFGSVEYRDAEKAKNKIKEKLSWKVIDSRGLAGFASIDKEERYDRNWLISIAIESDLDVWWKDLAVQDWLVPAYIAPNAVDYHNTDITGMYSYYINEECIED